MSVEARVKKDTKLHKISARAVRPIIDILDHTGIDPNVITFGSLLFALGAGISLWRGWWLTAVLMLLCNGLSDVIDGELARRIKDRRKRALKEMGGFLDGAIDRIADLCIFLGLIARAFDVYDDLLIVICIAAGIGMHPISSYFRQAIENMGHGRDAKRPLTRAGFHVAIAITCLSVFMTENLGNILTFISSFFPWLKGVASFVTILTVDKSRFVFYWSTLTTVCLLTIFVGVFRFVNYVRMFLHLENKPAVDPIRHVLK
ncbi:MAG: CDP-alcohol phosphatidyltransferase family protein [Patescibacteria group bacterium]|jgi:phosphatidylglycerophosphate synthase